MIKCYSSWLTLGVVPLCNVQTSGILHLALSILAQHTVPTSLHDAATDCITSLLARLEREVGMMNVAMQYGGIPVPNFVFT